MILKKVISGGQTGADMGGLIGARRAGLETAGCAPMGWLTEEGPKPELLQSYGLWQCNIPGYTARTRTNIQLSDATLILGNILSRGSKLSKKLCIELNKPYKHLTFDELDEVVYIANWVISSQIECLNVAGNRESRTPGTEKAVTAFISDLHKVLCDEPCTTCG